MNLSDYALTAYSHGGGCGCKIAPSVLDTILHQAKPAENFENLLVGNQSRDDAAVYHLGNGQALISTTDFFMPIVDDAVDFGKIASANAISDVYAMGGKPVLAIAILGWPIDKLPAELANKVLEGARAICAEAGIPLAGGHSIDSPEPIFGLAVNGLVAVANLKQNNTAKPGDLLFLTKSIGTGILSTAQKRKKLSPLHYAGLLNQLIQLNKAGAALGNVEGVHAMTDVTGFGLLGHLIEMAEGAGLHARIRMNAIPLLEGARFYLEEGIQPGATKRNAASYFHKVQNESGLQDALVTGLLADPQTNGGLLIAAAPEAREEVQEILSASGLANYIEPIGELQASGSYRVTLI
ncbi:selenide, water dikinase SelD [Flavihumibacter sp. CACIAM 22H1]|uniref:selenide, water dikinase SelD n=1 Tax=Flavihumibacter sp. CACIAM 22H1 TaxID=1812911 RepID=UPI0007A878D4|nr:selenide, water dikinase SelD [Flavihumibacter sp. CACIAM 22H1]KYP13417.1 MAG: selenide, water dikinase [Flavihumibacter sp. CACIAM 22H1]